MASDRRLVSGNKICQRTAAPIYTSAADLCTVPISAGQSPGSSNEYFSHVHSSLFTGKFFHGVPLFLRCPGNGAYHQFCGCSGSKRVFFVIIFEQQIISFQRDCIFNRNAGWADIFFFSAQNLRNGRQFSHRS